MSEGSVINSIARLADPEYRRKGKGAENQKKPTMRQMRGFTYTIIAEDQISPAFFCYIRRDTAAGFNQI